MINCVVLPVITVVCVMVLQMRRVAAFWIPIAAAPSLPAANASGASEYGHESSQQCGLYRQGDRCGIAPGALYAEYQ